MSDTLSAAKIDELDTSLIQIVRRSRAAKRDEIAQVIPEGHSEARDWMRAAYRQCCGWLALRKR